MSPFTREFWVADDPDEVNYEHRPDVVLFPSRHARANAFQAAQLLESDREAVRMDEQRGHLLRLLRENRIEHSRLQAALVALGGSLEESTHV